MSAKGGGLGGDGGFAEVSGKEYLIFAGNVNTSAPLGEFGTLLLDPTDLTIVADADADTEGQALTNFDQFTDPDFTGDGDNINEVSATTISNASSNVTLQATNNITFNAPISITNASIGLTAQANNSIFVNSTIATNNGAVTLNADADATNGGAIVLNSGSSITTNGGNITLGGGANPATTAAIGTLDNPATLNINETAGVTLAGTTLNAGTGTISIRGQGYADTTAGGSAGGTGIALSGTNTLNASAVTLTGIGGQGAPGVNATTSGSSGTNAGQGATGGSGINLAAASSITSSGNLSLIATGGQGGTGGTGATGAGNAFSAGGQGGTGGIGFVVTNGSDIEGSTLNLTFNPGAAGLGGQNAGGGGTGLAGSLGATSALTGAVTLTGDEITLSSNSNLIANGSASLVLQPLTPSQNIQLGGTDPDASTLSLTKAELDLIQNGFSSITIGRTNSSRTITLDGSSGLTFNDPVTLRGTDFTLQGSNTGSSTYTLSGTKAGSITGGNITLNGGSTLLFSGANRIQAGSGNSDTITGLSNSVDTFALGTTADTSPLISITTSGITFTGIETVNGNGGSDILQGGSGIDQFTLTSTGLTVDKVNNI
ncbi:MAG: beta strand repeat-containing protein, partial [Prochlorotrichaceae cyanobacterium]